MAEVGFEDPAGLAAGAAAELGDEDGGMDAVENGVRVPLEEPLIGAGKSVLRQPGDGLEKGRAHFIVQIHAGQLFLSRPGETRSDITGEVGDRRDFQLRGGHRRKQLFYQGGSEGGSLASLGRTHGVRDGEHQS